MNSLTYPMTLNYREHWNIWCALREFYQNAYDEDPEFEISKDPQDLLIIDHGKGMAMKHLLFGTGDKASDQRGQFGEGLKIAMLVCLREGYPVSIESGKYLIITTEAQLLGETVMRVAWEDGHNFPGTTVIVQGYTGPTYERRIIRPDDPRIIFKDDYGRMVLQEEPTGIYIKDIWVQEARFYGRPSVLSYNLADVKIDESRNIVNSWSAGQEIGRILAKLDDQEIVYTVMQAIDDDMGESHATLSVLAYPDLWKRAFKERHGSHAVVQSDSAVAREAEHMGAKPIEVPYSVRSALSGAIGDDQSYVAEMRAGLSVPIKLKNLSVKQRRHWNLIKRLAARIDPGIEMKVYRMTPLGAAFPKNKRMHISPAALDDPVTAIATLIEELDHIVHGTKDLSQEQLDGIPIIAARLLIPYCVRS